MIQITRLPEEVKRFLVPIKLLYTFSISPGTRQWAAACWMSEGKGGIALVADTRLMMNCQGGRPLPHHTTGVARVERVARPPRGVGGRSQSVSWEQPP